MVRSVSVCRVLEKLETVVKLVVAWSLAVKDNRLGVRNRECRAGSASMSHCHCPGPGHCLSLGLLTDLLPASN